MDLGQTLPAAVTAGRACLFVPFFAPDSGHGGAAGAVEGCGFLRDSSGHHCPGRGRSAPASGAVSGTDAGCACLLYRGGHGGACCAAGTGGRKRHRRAAPAPGLFAGHSGRNEPRCAGGGGRRSAVGIPADPLGGAEPVRSAGCGAGWHLRGAGGVRIIAAGRTVPGSGGAGHQSEVCQLDIEPKQPVPHP